MKLTIEEIAETCHEVNRAYCHALGDYSQPPWRFLTDDIIRSAIDGVRFHLDYPDATPEQSHENWMKFKIQDGWKYGVKKDMIKKEHPCLVPYGALPVEQRAKDFMFSSLVDTLKSF